MDNKSDAIFSTRPANWSAVFSLFLGVTCLISAEWTPISLLTPIARDLYVTEGLAGQTVALVGIFAVITSLMLAPLAGNSNRRHILLCFSSLLVISNCIVASAQSYALLMVGRGLLGICVGGFWSMSAAVTLHLVPSAQVPKALSIIYAGSAVAVILSLPVASYLGHAIGWRNTFYVEAVFGAVAFIWQYRALPSMKPAGANSFRSMLSLMQTRWVFWGVLATICSFAGYNVLFTYIRPYLELNLHLEPALLSLALGIFGAANCLGTFGASPLFKLHFCSSMIVLHCVLAIFVLLLIAVASNVSTSLVLLTCFGLFWSVVPVGWTTWITRTMPDRAELAGGISVAAIQFAIGGAASLGGVIFDHIGIDGIFITAALLLILAAWAVRFSFMLFAKSETRKI